jgi:AraC-like DNA-binding protein
VASEATISAVLVRPLVVALLSIEGATDAFWRATDLTPEIVADDEARVSPAQFCVAWAEALRLSKDRALALSIAEALPLGAFGVVEYVCRSAPTVREALVQWVRYLGILDDAVEVGLVDLGGDAALRVITESEAPAPASHELCFALIVRHAKSMAPNGFEVVEVRFDHRVPDSLTPRYRAVFGAPVRFGAERTELVLSNRALDATLVTADPNLLGVLLPTAEEKKREQRSPELPLTRQVRRVLRSALSHDDAQLDEIARRLGMTPRSLQRRLHDEGVSFQSLRDETRRTLADRYLGEGLSVAEVSFLLGFSEPSAFFRAFKRWTGLTPIEHRAQAR